jgi:hypothetical protein
MQKLRKNIQIIQTTTPIFLYEDSILASLRGGKIKNSFGNKLTISSLEGDVCMSVSKCVK